MTRAQAAEDFLKAAGWAAAVRGPLAGDASNRRYERLWRAGQTAVLMDAPPDKGEDVRPFVRIARHLSGLGLSAPQILAEDAGHGFLLLEDLGDALFARVLRDDPAQERVLYPAAAEVLAALHAHPAPEGLADYRPDMPGLGALAIDWYAVGGQMLVRPFVRDGLVDALAEALDRLAPVARPVLVQRDYHAENLIWLPGRDGAARVGLLDFQDARAGHPAYDLVSVVEDARRDVSDAARDACIQRYLDLTGFEEQALSAAMAALGAQRNLRILGVFARLSMHYGKPGYVDLIPRVWGHLRRDLAHPGLAGVAKWCAVLPAPTPAVLQGIRDLCGTMPLR